MVVKKHATFETACYQYKLRLLAEYIQQLNQQSDFEPGLGDLLQNCNRIVDCLVSLTGSETQINQLLSSVEEFLIRKVTSLTDPYRHDMVTTILDRLHFVTSNPQSSASSLASVVLVVCVGLDNDSILNAARELLDDQEKGAPARLRASLSCFYQWICDWNSRAALGDWLLAFIKVLEEKEHFDILIEISLEKLDSLFLALAAPNAMHRSVSDVILYVMASLRESKPAFDKIAPAINHMLMVLASDSNQWSRQLLQNVVDVSKSMIDNIKKQAKDNEFMQFQVKHSRVMTSLEEHMGTRSCSFLNLQPWQIRPPVSVVRLPAKKPGLVNLGNTCYMNCIIQALFATKQFTNQVVMNMSERPYWSKLGSVFADLMHSSSPKITPSELFSVVKTLFVSVHQQQDCSEFLGHLLSVLTSYELDSEENFDYSRPVKIIPSRKTCTTVVVYESPFSNVIVKHPREPTRSVSPGPGTSTSESVPSAGKRSNEDTVDDSEDSQNKRQCTIITLDTFVEQIFSGVLLKHIHCSNCQAMSVSREKVRELQLSVPENRRGFRMTIQGLIDFYYSSELFTGDNMYHCYSCSELSTAVRVLFCDIAPKYLIVVLKCFRYDQRVNAQKKLMLSVFLNQSVTLQILNPEIENKYSLYCCVIHEGSAATGGHYYTAAKHNNKWYLFNDDKVSQVGDDYLLKLNRTSTPYMLLYRRSDIIEESNPTLDEIPFKYREKIMSNNKTIDDSVRKLQRNKPLSTRSMKDVDVAYLD